MRDLATHVGEEHPDEPRTDEQLREHVARHAEDPPDRPPWAY